MRRLLTRGWRPLLAAVAILAAGGAAAALLTVALADGPAEGDRVPLEVAASLSPRTHLFGDEVTADVLVRLDRREVDPDSVQVTGTFAPYGVVGRPRVTRSTSGDAVAIDVRFRLFCLRGDCRPAASGRRRVVLRPPRVVLRLRAGTVRGTSVALPPLDVASRLTASDRLRPALVVGDEPLPVVSYRVSPRRLAAGLAALAAVLGLAGVLALALEGRRALRLARARRRRPPTPLEHALGVVRRAGREGDERERRLALDALARVVAAADGALAASIRSAAWASTGPRGRDLDRLADGVEASLGARA